jgi:hypothetical protein
MNINLHWEKYSTSIVAVAVVWMNRHADNPLIRNVVVDPTASSDPSEAVGAVPSHRYRTGCVSTVIIATVAPAGIVKAVDVTTPSASCDPATGVSKPSAVGHGCCGDAGQSEPLASWHAITVEALAGTASASSASVRMTRIMVGILKS